MPLGERLVRQMVEDEGRVGQIVEQRLQPVIEEGKPVLHAGKAAALADRGIERVVARGRAESLQIVAAETADALFRQRYLAHAFERDAVALAGGALRGDIEGADGFQRVAEEIEPQRLSASRREEIEDAAAHCVFADLAHRCDALEAVALQPPDQRVHVDPVAGAGGETLRRDRFHRRHALQERVGGGQDQAAMRAGPERRHGAHRLQPLRGNTGAGRNAVVRQAVPRRQFEHGKLGRGEGQRIHQRRQPLAVAGDEDQRAVRRRLGRGFGKGEGLVAVGYAVHDHGGSAAILQSDCVDELHFDVCRLKRIPIAGSPISAS